MTTVASQTIDFSTLQAQLSGAVLTDPLSLGLYATDASMYQIVPCAVAVPRDRKDLVAAVRWAGEHRVPIVARGAGTSLTGQSVGAALILDTSKYMNRVLALDVEARQVRVEPGLVRDELNAQLKPHDLHFAPDPATSNRANIGGMLANNAAGMRSIRYGMTIDHVVALDLALPTGEILNLGEIDEAAYARKCELQDREGEFYRGFRTIIEAHRAEIKSRYPKVKRHSGGYALDAFIRPGHWNMAKLIAGSEGTLGVILEATLNLEPLPPCNGLCLAHFASMSECLRAVAPIVSHGPSAVELIDGIILKQARENLLTRETMRCVEGEPAGILVIEAQGDRPDEVEATLAAIVEELHARGMGYALPIMRDAAQIKGVWEMRSNALGLMTTVEGDRKPVPYIEDAAVPLEHLPEYIEAVLAICEREGQPVSLFAHASVGLLHIRPMHDLHEHRDIAQLKKIQDEVFELVVRYRGAWSGEHGDGIVRGGYNLRYFGEALYEAFGQIKHLLDPWGLMNPGKIIDTPPMDTQLRFGERYHRSASPTWFHYRGQGGLMRAVELCTGVGTCRKTLAGTMCPSYIATRDEAQSTRGRANALRLAMTGQLGLDGLGDAQLKSVLDLCLACKGCKNECPNNVDMARFKAEAGQAYHERHGTSLREQLFANPHWLGSLLAGPQASLVNRVVASQPVRQLLAGLGIAPQRVLPAYASQTLTQWDRRRQPSTETQRPRVALFVDTYMEYHEPCVGKAAVRVLEAAGFAVEVVRAGDSQRPAISKGMLRLAKRRGQKLIAALDAYASQGMPILVCEPSCASALSDDLPDLIDDAAMGQRVAGQVQMIDTFLLEALREGRCQLPWRGKGLPTEIFLHGHCHQKALEGIAPTRDLLRQIPGVTVRESGAGCCGMAGGFGYEREHYEVSVAVAGDRLLPALEQLSSESWVVANGFSCRHQIADLSSHRAMHSIEAIARCLTSDE